MRDPGSTARRLGVPAFYDAQKMLEALKPDVCGVTTAGFEYSSDHFEPTMQALEAGCHVLGEKPISNEIARGEEMVAAGGVELEIKDGVATGAADGWRGTRKCRTPGQGGPGIDPVRAEPERDVDECCGGGLLARYEAAAESDRQWRDRPWIDLGEPEQYNSKDWTVGIVPGRHGHADYHNLYNFK